MKPPTARFLAAFAVALQISVGSLWAQGRELALRITRAVAALDSAQTERGVDSLRALLGEWPEGGSTELRVRAHIYLGSASLALGFRDSAFAHFGEAVRLNPFAVPDPDIFNPDVLAAFREARRSTPSLRLKVAADTVIRPLAEAYLVAVAVGQPGSVTLRVLRADGAAAGTATIALNVDSTSSSVIPLRVSDSLPLEPGDYQLVAEVPGAATQSATIRLRVTRTPVDTTVYEPALDSTLFRPEMRKGPPVPISAVSGIAFGAVAAAVPMLLGNKDLAGGRAQVPAISVGVGISVAGIAGVVLGRRMVPIQENIQHNRSLVSAWEQRNRAIAEANEQKRRIAALRITLMEERP